MITVILADGSFPVHKIPLSYLDDAEIIICCDGAAAKLEEYGLEPSAIVGDHDSLSESLKTKYRDRLFADSDQETNDLTKAVKWCADNGITEVVILGATGIREDHTLGNISLLADYSKSLNVMMLTDTGSIRVYDRSVTIGSIPGQQVSLFSVDNRLKVTSSGLKYPLSDLLLESWWRGTLNEATGDTFSLRFGNGRVIVFQKHPES